MATVELNYDAGHVGVVREPMKGSCLQLVDVWYTELTWMPEGSTVGLCVIVDHRPSHAPASAKLDERKRIKLEIAASEGLGIEHLASFDSGIGFDLRKVGETTSALQSRSEDAFQADPEAPTGMITVGISDMETDPPMPPPLEHLPGDVSVTNTLPAGDNCRAGMSAARRGGASGANRPKSRTSLGAPTPAGRSVIGARSPVAEAIRIRSGANDRRLLHGGSM